MVAFASSLDQAGPIAKTVEDAAILMTSMSGHDPKDSTSIDADVPDFRSFVGKVGEGHAHRRAARVPHGGHAGRDRAALAAGDRLAAEAGCEIVDVSLPHTKYALPAYYIIAPAGGLVEPAPLRRHALRPPRRGQSLTEVYENTRAEGFGDEVKRRVLIGTYVLSPATTTPIT
jgi:aspartyl-tRNA(Asn)/glutamyl-tRNA(Gln) amidotransferase subunit A